MIKSDMMHLSKEEKEDFNNKGLEIFRQVLEIFLKSFLEMVLVLLVQQEDHREEVMLDLI